MGWSAVIAFFVNFSRSGGGVAVVAGDTPASTGAVVVSLIKKLNALKEFFGGTPKITRETRALPRICNRQSEIRNSYLSHALGDRLGPGNIDILFAVSGNRTIR